MNTDNISAEQLIQARHMTQALLQAMTPYQVAKEIGVMYQTVVKIANAQTTWISLQTFDALSTLHGRWRSGVSSHESTRIDILHEPADPSSSDNLSYPVTAQRILHVDEINAEITRLEKRIVILHRLGDLADQL
jgi:hypothetical protein